ncbi:MAG: UDP-N-acetylmuramoyl-L-alanyl-D-glutamate--2,6-diaminopimelate ligase [Candidatus Nomurabacteria bacterium]|jgi:UDP-N-acetylmuramoyl-L-alanyl-D-glutamate--2,6-diaminopimelate ligase|nr:UDP-N-acetylmuramoyl-L-alanyl-D-glutamate--2,6-diaminopimelate ligase [Candidatus Nomurabacteria bacterium]
MSIKSKLADLPGYNKAVLPYHYWRDFRAASRYNYPAAGMTVIAVTGTSGKTTTCNMIFNMLKEAGFKVGLLTTVSWGDWRGLKPDELHLTTASRKALNERISTLRDAGVEYLVMEVSSHALAQGRIFGIPIDTAVLTNVTHEHLDYHRTLENYRRAKLKLFHKAKFSVINADDDSAKLFEKNSREYITYGINYGELRAKSPKVDLFGVKYIISDINLKISTQIPGQFNIYNSLAAAAVGRHYGLSGKQIAHGIASLAGVAGRMNRIDEGQNFTVIVDFAHKPDAMDKVFKSLGQVGGKVITLFGLPGRRDSTNRAIMGKLAGENSDYVIVTEDDSRDEPVEKISGQIVEGLDKSGNKNYDVILNREKAIAQAFKKARKGDVVLLLGKGHEQTIIRADGVHAWDDAVVARKLLKKLQKK